MESAELFRLAETASGAPDRLNDIYLAVAALFEGHATALSQRERDLAADICKRLSKDVEMSLRLSLAERIADNDEAPRELALLLADDRIDVARPVLARSRALTDDDLLQIVRGGSTEHQVTVAARPQIAEIVTAALADSQSDVVVITLVRNKSARIGAETFNVITERARARPALHGPLADRGDLPQQAAARLCTIVSEALKTALVQRYPQIASALSQAVDESARGLQYGSPGTSEANAVKLVAKLAQGGQLRASFLIRVLHQGQMDLFEHGFAKLLELDVERVRSALYAEKPELTAMACRAVGIDRCVFGTVFNLSRRQRDVKASLSEIDRYGINQVFCTFTKEAALDALKAALPA